MIQIIQLLSLTWHTRERKPDNQRRKTRRRGNACAYRWPLARLRNMYRKYDGLGIWRGRSIQAYIYRGVILRISKIKEEDGSSLFLFVSAHNKIWVYFFAFQNLIFDKYTKIIPKSAIMWLSTLYDKILQISHRILSQTGV